MVEQENIDERSTGNEALRAVLYRDNNICQICGKKGIKNPPGREDWKGICFELFLGKYIAFEIDHIVPEFHGGKTIIDNLMLVCRKCNRMKGVGA